MIKNLKRVFFCLFGLVFFTVLGLAATKPAFAVPVRTEGGVNSNYGYYTLKSMSNGNGDVTPGTSVNVDSYLFQCASRGNAACSTQWNSDAKLVKTWQNTLTVPQMDQTTNGVRHNFDFSLPYGQCGRLQYDNGINGISGAIGGWVYDFGKDCNSTTSSGSAPNNPPSTCQTESPLIQFRRATNGNWSSSGSVSPTIKVGESIDVNCFAKNGTALFQDGYITVTTPFGQTTQVSNTAELRNYAVLTAGNYAFSCQSRTVSSCSSNDTLAVTTAAAVNPSTCSQSCSSTQPCATGLTCTGGMCRNPSCSNESSCNCPAPTVTQKSSCDNLSVISGNNSLVPATVRFRATGSDNLGSIQKYRFFFGDGEQVESDVSEIEHKYNVSGTFTVRADVKDSKGNYQTSSACQTTVSVQSAPVESHKSACSNIYVTADNGAYAPSTVSVQVTGFDNKNGLQGYRVDFGNGIITDSSTQNFSYKYEKVGSYVIKGYIKDSEGNWIGGDSGCQKTIAILSKQPLTTQPKTGTPTALPILGGLSGILGIAIEVAKRKVNKA
jgi:hypothetical protein